MTDTVNHPPHYTGHRIFSGECHRYTRHMSFDQGNPFKYTWRYEDKNGIEDLKKALWYVSVDDPFVVPLHPTKVAELVKAVEDYDRETDALAETARDYESLTGLNKRRDEVSARRRRTMIACITAMIATGNVSTARAMLAAAVSLIENEDDA